MDDLRPWTWGWLVACTLAKGVLATLIFLALFAFFDFINELDDVGRGGYRLQHAAGYVLLGLPDQAYELVPIAALIGAIYALAQFAQHSEFTAMRAAGLGRAPVAAGSPSPGPCVSVTWDRSKVRPANAW